jgi:hypothetical protein
LRASLARIWSDRRAVAAKLVGLHVVHVGTDAYFVVHGLVGYSRLVSVYWMCISPRSDRCARSYYRSANFGYAGIALGLKTLGYRPNPGLRSTPLYVLETVALLITWQGLSFLRVRRFGAPLRRRLPKF